MAGYKAQICAQESTAHPLVGFPGPNAYWSATITIKTVGSRMITTDSVAVSKPAATVFVVIVQEPFLNIQPGAILKCSIKKTASIRHSWATGNSDSCSAKNLESDEQPSNMASLTVFLTK